MTTRGVTDESEHWWWRSPAVGAAGGGDRRGSALRRQLREQQQERSGAAATTAAAAETTAAAAETTAAAADTSAPAAGSSAPTEVEGKVTDFAGYVGGSGAADSSKSPIKIGYFNQQGGSIEVTHTNVDGIKTAVKFINEEAGGIGGHPLEVVTCYVANTEEEGQQCGQKFANDKDIVAVVAGPTFIGTESFYAALAGAKPVVSGVSVNPADTVQKAAAVLYGGAKYILAPYATFARDTLKAQVGGARLSGRLRPG